MNEWTVVTVLVALVGLFFTIGKPIINLNSAITKLQVTVDNLMREVDGLKAANAASHEKIYDQLDNHESRIVKLEVRTK